MGHHFVPQRYLKGFQTKTGKDFIWMYDKQKRTAKSLPIERVAQVPGFYDDEVESALNVEVEKPGNDVIDKLKAGDAPDEGDRRHLTYYIATMIARVPAARALATRFVPGALAGVTEDIKKAIDEAARLGLIDEATKERRNAEADAAYQKFQKQPPVQVKKVIETPWPFERWLVAIYNMTWRVVETKGPSYFATSDNPATLLAGSGLHDDWCELTFPLSKGLLLHCSWQGDGGYERRLPWGQFVKECNRRTVFSAQRFIFYHEEVSWIMQLADNPAPKFNQINWRYPS